MTASGGLTARPTLTTLRASCRSCKAWGSLAYREEGKGLGSFRWVKASGTFSLNRYDEPSCACGAPVYRRKMPQGRATVELLPPSLERPRTPALIAPGG